MNTNNNSRGFDLWMPLMLLIVVFVLGIGGYAVARSLTKPNIDEYATRHAVAEYETE